MIRDKSLFSWVDPNDVSGTARTEYPVEPPANHGRVVGEVHIDYVPVEYRKETFKLDAPEWLAVVRFLRGDEGPMRPKYRREMGYPGLLQGPLSTIYRAFNANRPGARYLIPGNGQHALHEQAREWSRKFYDAVEEYEADTVWWTAVEAHDRIASAGDEAPRSRRTGVVAFLAGARNDPLILRPAAGPRPGRRS